MQKHFIRPYRLILLFLLFWVHFAQASSLFDRRTSTGRFVFETLLSQSVPREALDLLFRMFDYNQGRIANTDYAVLVDYSRPSIEKRLLLLDLREGRIEQFYVAHGIRSGVVEARSFSNIPDSWQSSLGFYYASEVYNSPKNGLSLYLDGIDRSNDNTRIRNIVLHGSSYVSEDFISQNGRLGWSEGCFAVPLEDVQYLADILQGGSLLLAYHKDLMRFSRRYPLRQSLTGEERIAPGVNTNRTPGEGGGLDFFEIKF